MGILAAIFLVALFVRLGNIHFTSRGQLEVREDAVDYYSLGQNIAREGRYIDGNGHLAVRMPGYPLFLAGLFKIFGENVLAVQVVQAVLNALGCILLYFGARVLVPPNWALIVSAIAAGYFDYFTGSARILSESVYLFVLTLFLVLWLQCQTKNLIQALALGLVMGGAILFRPEALLMGGLAGFFVYSGSLGKRLLHAAIFWFGIGLVMAPWVARNRYTLNAWVPLTTRASASAYVGMQTNMTRLGVIQGETFDPEIQHELNEYNSNMEKTKSLYENVSFGTIIKSITFNVSVLLYPFHPQFDPIMFFFIPFWLGGLALVLARKSPDAILVVYTLTLVTAYIFFGATVSRYREPLAPATILLSVIGLYHLYKKNDQRKFMAALGCWGGFVGLVLAFQHPIRNFLLMCRDRIW